MISSYETGKWLIQHQKVYYHWKDAIIPNNIQHQINEKSTFYVSQIAKTSPNCALTQPGRMTHIFDI